MDDARWIGGTLRPSAIGPVAAASPPGAGPASTTTPLEEPPPLEEEPLLLEEPPLLLEPLPLVPAVPPPLDELLDASLLLPESPPVAGPAWSGAPHPPAKTQHTPATYVVTNRRIATLVGGSRRMGMTQSFCHTPTVRSTRSSAVPAAAKAIQELAEHASLTTTLRYMHLSPSARTSAIELLNARPADFGEIVETDSSRGANDRNSN